MPQDPLMPQTPQPKAKPSIDEWEEQVRQKYNIPQKLWRGMAAQESGGDRNAVSPTGVRGKYQVTESTAKSYGLDRNDPYQQAEAAAKHLRKLYDTTPQIKSDSGRWWGAVAKYYGGDNAVDEQGNFSDSSIDGVSTPLRHVNNLARRIQEMDKQSPSVVNPQNPAAPVVAPAPKPAPMKARPKPVTTARGPIIPKANPFDVQGNASANLIGQAQNIAAKVPQAAPGQQPTPPSGLREVGNRAMRALVSNVASMPTGYALRQANEYRGLNLPMPGGQNLQVEPPVKWDTPENIRQKVEVPLKEYARQSYPVDETKQRSYNPLNPNFYTVTAPEVIGGMAPLMAQGLLTKGNPVASALLSSDMGSAMNAGAAYDEARQAGFTEKDAQYTGKIGAAIGSIQGLIGIGSGASAEAVKRGLWAQARQALAQGGEMGLQRWLNNINAKAVSGHDPSRPLMSGVGEAALEGTMVGGAHQILQAAPKLLRARPQPRPVDVSRADETLNDNSMPLTPEEVLGDYTPKYLDVDSPFPRRVAIPTQENTVQPSQVRPRGTIRIKGVDIPESEVANIRNTVKDPTQRRKALDDLARKHGPQTAPAKYPGRPEQPPLFSPQALPEKASTTPPIIPAEKPTIALEAPATQAEAPIPPTVPPEVPPTAPAQPTTKPMPPRPGEARIPQATEGTRGGIIPRRPGDTIQRPVGPSRRIVDNRSAENATPTTLDDTLMFAERPAVARNMKAEGERVIGEQAQRVAEGTLKEGDFRGPKRGTAKNPKFGQYGDVAYALGRSPYQKIPGDVTSLHSNAVDIPPTESGEIWQKGANAVIGDPEVKAALDLPPEANQEAVRDAVREDVAKRMGLPPDVSLAQVPPNVWLGWARSKGFSPGLIARMNKSIELARGKTGGDALPPNETPQTPMAARQATRPSEGEPIPFKRGTTNVEETPAARTAQPEQFETPMRPAPEAVPEVPAMGEAATQPATAGAKVPRTRKPKPFANDRFVEPSKLVPENVAPVAPVASEPPVASTLAPKTRKAKAVTLPRTTEPESVAVKPAPETMAEAAPVEPVAKTAPTTTTKKASPPPLPGKPKYNEATLREAGFEKVDSQLYKAQDGRSLEYDPDHSVWQIKRPSGEGTETFSTQKEAIESILGKPPAPVMEAPVRGAKKVAPTVTEKAAEAKGKRAAKKAVVAEKSMAEKPVVEVAPSETKTASVAKPERVTPLNLPKQSMSRSNLDSQLKDLGLRPAERQSLLDEAKSTEFRYDVPGHSFYKKGGTSERKGQSYSVEESSKVLRKAYAMKFGEAAVESGVKQSQSDTRAIAESNLRRSDDFKVLKEASADLTPKQIESIEKQASDAGITSEVNSMLADYKSKRTEYRSDPELRQYLQDNLRDQQERLAATNQPEGSPTRSFYEKRIQDLTDEIAALDKPPVYDRDVETSLRELVDPKTRILSSEGMRKLRESFSDEQILKAVKNSEGKLKIEQDTRLYDDLQAKSFRESGTGQPLLRDKEGILGKKHAAYKPSSIEVISEPPSSTKMQQSIAKAAVTPKEVVAEKPTVAEAKPVETPVEPDTVTLTNEKRVLGESLAKKYGSPVPPTTPASEPYESVARFSNMLERAATKSTNDAELKQILSQAEGLPEESRIARAIEGNPHSSDSTFADAQSNPALKSMATDESLMLAEKRRQELRKQQTSLPETAPPTKFGKAVEKAKAARVPKQKKSEATKQARPSEPEAPPQVTRQVTPQVEPEAAKSVSALTKAHQDVISAVEGLTESLRELNARRQARIDASGIDLDSPPLQKSDVKVGEVVYDQLGREWRVSKNKKMISSFSQEGVRGVRSEIVEGKEYPITKSYKREWGWQSDDIAAWRRGNLRQVTPQVEPEAAKPSPAETPPPAVSEETKPIAGEKPSLKPKSVTATAKKPLADAIREGQEPKSNYTNIKKLREQGYTDKEIFKLAADNEEFDLMRAGSKPNIEATAPRNAKGQPLDPSGEPYLKGTDGEYYTPQVTVRKVEATTAPAEFPAIVPGVKPAKSRKTLAKSEDVDTSGPSRLKELKAKKAALAKGAKRFLKEEEGSFAASPGPGKNAPSSANRPMTLEQLKAYDRQRLQDIAGTKSSTSGQPPINKKTRTAKQSTGQQPAQPESIRGKVFSTAGTVQTWQQLGNPGFVGRNIIQHAGYAAQSGVADRLASGIDAVFSRVTGKPRQIKVEGVPLVEAAKGVKSYWNSLKDAYKAQKSGQPLPGKLTAAYSHASTNPVEKAFNSALSYINEVPDAANWQTQYNRSLKSLTSAEKTRGGTITPERQAELMAQAQVEANHSSLRDENFISRSLLNLKKTLNTLSAPITGTDQFGLGDFVAKYGQVPGALLKRGIEYSPLGLFEASHKAFKATHPNAPEFARRDAIKSLSQALTGTATTVGMGALLAATGVVVEPSKSNITSETLESEQGVRGFSINLSALGRLASVLFGITSAVDAKKLRQDDKLMPIDWFQPWALGASVGATLWNIHSGKGLTAASGAEGVGEAVSTSFTNALNILGDQGVLSNIKGYLEKGDSLKKVVEKFAKDIPTSFTSSAGRQINRVIDPDVRDYRAEQRGSVKGAFTEGMKRAVSDTIPGLPYLSPTKTSVLTGQPKKTAQGEMSTTARILNFISPVSINKYKDDPLAKEVVRLNEYLDKNRLNVYAPALSSQELSLKHGSRYEEPTSLLRQREDQFAKEFAAKARRLINTPGYQTMKDEKKADAIRELVGAIRKATYKTGDALKEPYKKIAADINRQPKP